MGIGAVGDLLGGGVAGGATGLLTAVRRTIEIDGSELPPEIDRQVESVTVVDRLRMPDSFVLVLRDPGRSILAEAGIEIGAKVKIATTAPGGEAPEDLFWGEITSIEAEYDRLGSRAVVRGYDLLHRLSGGRKTRTYENVTYSDIAEEIAGEAGLDTDVDDSGSTHEHVLQPNVSDLEFLQGLARRVGFDVIVEEDTLLFKEAPPASDAPGAGNIDSSDPTQLVWDHNLLEFHARISAVAQVTEVKVRGWNVTDREPIIGQASAETALTRLDLSPDDLAERVGGGELVVVDRPVADQAEADDLAEVIAEQVASAAYEATAIAIGSPKLRAGQAVTVSKVDEAFAGDWVITTARHEFGGGAYRTHLEFSGRQDRSLHGLVTGGSGGSRPGVGGVVVGIVTDNDDPDALGRVKVEYPWLGDEAVSHWARVATIGAGKEMGITWIPQVDDEVLVAFEHGDMAHPFVVGSLWNGQAKPPMVSDLFDDGAVKKAALLSRHGHGLIFHDNDEDSGIVLATKSGDQFLGFSETDGTIVLKCAGKQIEIETSGDLVLKADGKVKIEAGTTFDLTAGGNMTIKGAKVAIN